MKHTLNRSRLILVYLLLVHLAALLLVNLYGAIILRLSGTVLIIASLIYYCQLYGWWPGQQAAIIALREEDGLWFITSRDGREQGMRLVRSVMLGPFLAIYFKAPQRGLNRSLLIVYDALDRDSWRRLRVRLRDPDAWD
ncbi:MAG: hypothetical protein Kow0083_02000 [Methylophaga sp.]